MKQPIYRGGCQCGALRFLIEGKPKETSICHCRMCQKAFGAYYAPLVSTRGSRFTWTRGAPNYFQSSNHVRRGFCERCGTPLTYEAADGIAVAAGALDDPAALPPSVQYGVEAKLSFTDHLGALPAHHTLDDIDEASFLVDIVSNQHPDFETDEWQPIAATGGTSKEGEA